MHTELNKTHQKRAVNSNEDSNNKSEFRRYLSNYKTIELSGTEFVLMKTHFLKGIRKEQNLLGSSKMLFIGKFFNFICRAYNAVGDSQTNKDTSTKATQIKTTNYDSNIIKTITPRITSWISSNISRKIDPNLTAMEALKEKLKSFIINHKNVMAKMEKEIITLRKENEMLKQINNKQ